MKDVLLATTEEHVLKVAAPSVAARERDATRESR